MKVVIQRVKEANVKVSNNIVGKINKGLLILVGFTNNDNSENIKYIANKIINLRIFDDENGVMNKSCIDMKYSLLSVSQFTLYGDTSRGNRPSYIESLKHEEAEKLYNEFNAELRKSNLNIETGIFRADMEVSLINDGPVTIIMER